MLHRQSHQLVQFGIPRVIIAHRTLRRAYSATTEPSLKDELQNSIAEKKELLKQVKSHAGASLGDCKVENTIGGMRLAGVRTLKVGPLTANS